MGNYSHKEVSDEGIVYYTFPNYEGKKINEVYKGLIKKYTDYSVLVLANQSTTNLITKHKMIIVYSTDGIINRVEMYRN